MLLINQQVRVRMKDSEHTWNMGGADDAGQIRDWF